MIPVEVVVCGVRMLVCLVVVIVDVSTNRWGGGEQ